MVSGHPSGCNWLLCKIWYAYLLYSLSLVLPKFLVLTVLYSIGFKNLNLVKTPKIWQIGPNLNFSKIFQTFNDTYSRNTCFLRFSSKIGRFLPVFLLLYFSSLQSKVRKKLILGEKMIFEKNKWSVATLQGVLDDFVKFGMHTFYIRWALCSQNF